MLNEEGLHYLGGFFDADGCIIVRSGSTLIIEIGQATRGAITIYLLQKVFGGTVYVEKAKKAEHQDIHKWVIRGNQAVELSSILKNYTYLKTNQLLIASTFPSKEGNIMLQNKLTGERNTFSKLSDASLHFGGTKNTLSNHLLGQKSKLFSEWNITRRYDRITLKQAKKDIDDQLRIYKKEPHIEITNRPHNAYYAGFFDGEGTIRTKNLRAQAPQLYTPILESLQRSFGGQVRWAGNKYLWITHGKEAEKFYNAILPYVLGKYPQIIIALANPNDDCSESLQKYKGHQVYTDIFEMSDEYKMLEIRRDNWYKLFSV